MSERTPDEKLNELIGLFEAMDEGGAPPPLLGVLVGETHTALTELLALRAEVERLRAVEKAARAHLDNTAWRSLCHGCNVFWHGRGHAPGCTQANLHAALSATKQEPGT